MVVRLAFGAAISVDPDILIIDEALAVGDERFQLKCFSKITKLRKQGTTVIYVSHDTRVVKEICHHVVLLNGGNVVAQGKAEEVVQKFDELMSDTGVVAPEGIYCSANNFQVIISDKIIS